MPETCTAQVSRGRVTISSTIREVLRIKDGDYVRLTIEKIVKEASQ